MALNTFSNGLRLVCSSRADKKVACVVLHIAGGTQSEKNYQSGISEYLTRLLFMGTKYHSRESLIYYAKSHGIILTPHSSRESITISALCPKENIETAIKLLSEIVFDTDFYLENGEKVKNALLAQVDMLQENPSYQMDKLINSTLYYRTGLANPKSGTAITVSRFRALDAEDFLAKIFTPRNTIISVVGDVSQDAIYDLVKVHFFDRMKNEEDGDYKKLKYVSAIDGFVGSCKGRVKRLNQTRISVSFPTVSYKDKEKYIIEIVKPILLNNIKRALANHKYYYDIKIKTKYFANNGHLTFEIAVDYEYAEKFIKAFVAALAHDIKNRPIASDDFETETKVYITNFINTYDNVVEQALIEAKQVAITKQTFSENSERMKMLIMTNKDATKLISEILDFEKMVVVYLGHDINIELDDLLEEI